MSVHFKIPQRLYYAIRRDLQRPHEHAFERVGFIACRVGDAKDGLAIVAHAYCPVADQHYLRDETVGAMMSSEAIRAALQHSLRYRVSMFHVHEHPGVGIPVASRTDRTEWANFVPNFKNVQPGLPHGALVFSTDQAMGLYWMPGADVARPIDRFTVAGSPIRTWTTR